MNWFFIALIAPFLWAIVNIADHYLIAKFSDREKERSSGGLVIFSSVIGLFIALMIWIFNPSVFDIPTSDIILLLITGVLTVVWIVLYLFTLEIEEVSRVVPWFLTVPVFGYVLGNLFLGETLNSKQIAGAVMIFIGLIIISIRWNEEKRKLKRKPLIYMLCACLAIAVSGIIFKYVTVEGDFWVSSFWEYLGIGVTGLFMFIFMAKQRREFLHMNTKGGFKILVVNIASEFLSVTGNLLTNFALILAPVSLVFLVGSLQPAILLILTVLATYLFPKLIKEDMTWQVIFPKMLAIIIMIIGCAILFT